ncbi:DUF805 domain-containing protein [Flagellimonas algicola]|uniref:DUF805 domain-containing protein n=1 Tax=Flagellimonas algicola TaxID=2583815 RepID=A0ABY2WI20_9FLAO|nr:DUF805 domain-containing protein [Allomuricauda algicola]TMU50922.1 DUF805 domain-containing protein [Allomuricauda algicola]
MKWYLKVLKQYANFKGRARRKEFWMFYIIHAVFSGLAVAIDNITGLSGELPLGPIYGLYTLVMIVPILAVMVRRMHDIGKKWTWLLVGLIPAIGGIWLFFLWIKDGEPGENDYGVNPKLAVA